MRNNFVKPGKISVCLFNTALLSTLIFGNVVKRS